MKNTILFFNIYKNTTSHNDRNRRVSSILNPIYHVTLSNKEGKDIYRESHNLKLDSVFPITIPPNRILEKSQETKVTYRKKIYNYLLSELIGNQKYFGIHKIFYDDISKKDLFLITKWLHKQNFDNNTILDELIHIETPLQIFFKDRKEKFISSWKPIHNTKYNLVIFIYGTIDIRRNKIKFLIAEENVLNKSYDAPVLGLRYIFHLDKGKRYIDKLCSHLLYLENEGLKEKYYTWIENTLEKYYPPTNGSILHLGQQDFYNFFLESLYEANKENLFSNIYIRQKEINETERKITGNDESIEERKYKKEIAKLSVKLLMDCISEAQKTLWHFTPTFTIMHENDKLVYQNELEKHIPLNEITFSNN